MLCKLSLKNIKKSIKDYAIYFFTLILGVAIFYVFNALEIELLSSTGKDMFNAIITGAIVAQGGAAIAVALLVNFIGLAVAFALTMVCFKPEE